MSRRLRTPSLLATVLALVVAASGCADRGSDTAAGTLNVGQISNSVAFFPIFVAEQKGYFTQEGVKLGERPRLGTGAKVAAALKSGSIDLGGGVLTDAFNLASNDDGTRVVTNLVNKYYVDVVVGNDFDGPDAKAPLKDRINALKGKKIGITGPGSGTEALVTYLFAQQGLDPKTDAELVNLGSVATAAIGALKSKRVDALAFFQPIAQQAESAKVGVNYISPVRGDVPGLETTTHGVVFTTQGVLDKKAKEVAAFQRAIDRALADIHADPDGTRELLGKYLEAASPATLDALMPILIEEIPEKGNFPRAPFDTALKFHTETGLVEKAPAYEKIVPENLRAG
ncbi:MAG: PhnD/SsuA/transferrin family substrate-binding protein [Streptosporangiales bacterium]|nr:PhnD/SsuA/transferrin family substrate-binding protein [Streptosporangiales bacterium]